MKKNKFIKGLKFTAKWAFKICVAAAGITAMTNPASASITGAVALASVISAIIKDKDFKPGMKLVNIIACNIGNAKNDPLDNEDSFYVSKSLTSQGAKLPPREKF